MLGVSLKEDDFIFSDLEGKPLLPNTVSNAWIRLVRREGLKGIRLHDARHTHASLLLKQGIHPKTAKEYLSELYYAEDIRYEKLDIIWVGPDLDGPEL